MRDGWIKLHRKILDSAAWKCLNDPQRLVLITLLLMANHQKNKWVWKGKKYKCNPGEFITSRKAIAAAARVGEQSVRSALQRLAGNLEFLTMESTKEATKITILNWKEYQIKDAGNQPGTQPSTNQHPTTNKNVKNNKEIPDREKWVQIKGEKYQIIMDDWGPVPGFFYEDEWPIEFWEWAKEKHGASDEEMETWYRQFQDWHDKNRGIKKGHFKDWWRRWQDWTTLKAKDRVRETAYQASVGDWDPYASPHFRRDA